MKKLARFFCFTLLVLGMAGGANAAPIYDVVDFDDGKKKGRTAMKISAKGDPVTITHNVTFDPGDITIDNLTLTLSHLNNKGNKNNKKEAWLISDSNQIFLGVLERSKGKWVDQEFTLDAELYEGTFDGSWSIAFTLNGETVKNDTAMGKMWIDASTLSGNYSISDKQITVVPVPATILLLASGLAGLVGFRKKFKS